MWRNGWHDLKTTSKQRSMSFILVPIDWAVFNVSTKLQHSIGPKLSGRQFYRLKYPTNSIKVLKEKTLQK